MTLVQAVWDRLGGWLGRLVVIAMFLGAPLLMWALAMPSIQALPLGPDVRLLLTGFVFASVGFGAVSGWLVWRDLDDEP